MIKSFEELKQIINLFRNNWNLFRIEIWAWNEIVLSNEEFEKLFEKDPDDVKESEDKITEHYRYYEGEDDRGFDIFSDIEVDYCIKDNKIFVLEIRMQRNFEYS